MFRQGTTFSWLNKIGQKYPKILLNREFGWQNKIMSFNWGQFTPGMDMVRFLSHECLRQAYERNIVSFEWNLLNSLTIALYVRKNVVAFYGPIFASYTSVPQIRCRSVLKHVFKRCSREKLRLLRMIAEKSQKRLERPSGKYEGLFPPKFES